MKNKYLTSPQLQAELEKCLQCPTKPCLKACPAQVSPADFIALARKNEWAAAAAEIERLLLWRAKMNGQPRPQKLSAKIRSARFAA